MPRKGKERKQYQFHPSGGYFYFSQISIFVLYADEKSQRTGRRKRRSVVLDDEHQRAADQSSDDEIEIVHVDSHGRSASGSSVSASASGSSMQSMPRFHDSSLGCNGRLSFLRCVCAVCQSGDRRTHGAGSCGWSGCCVIRFTHGHGSGS